MIVLKIITLVENSSLRDDIICEHGLCLYIETKKHKLLSDAVQTDALIHNAEAIGIDLSAVDTVVPSHGHYDHSGGILPFCGLNDKAEIYMQRSALPPHYNTEEEISIITDTAKELAKTITRYYTGHCTGVEAFDI